MVARQETCSELQLFPSPHFDKVSTNLGHKDKAILLSQDWQTLYSLPSCASLNHFILFEQGFRYILDICVCVYAWAYRYFYLTGDLILWQSALKCFGVQPKYYFLKIFFFEVLLLFRTVKIFQFFTSAYLFLLLLFFFKGHWQPCQLCVMYHHACFVNSCRWKEVWCSSACVLWHPVEKRHSRIPYGWPESLSITAG